MHEVVPNSDSKSPSARTPGINAANLCKGASSACLSLFSNAQACQTGDWKFESSPKKIWHSTNKVYFKSLHFLRATPPLLWTALPSQHAALCFPEHVNIWSKQLQIQWMKCMTFSSVTLLSFFPRPDILTYKDHTKPIPKPIDDWTCENKSCIIRRGKVHLWNCCDLCHSHVLPTNEVSN